MRKLFAAILVLALAISLSAQVGSGFKGRVDLHKLMTVVSDSSYWIPVSGLQRITTKGNWSVELDSLITVYTIASYDSVKATVVIDGPGGSSVPLTVLGDKTSGNLLNVINDNDGAVGDSSLVVLPTGGFSATGNSSITTGKTFSIGTTQWDAASTDSINGAVVAKRTLDSLSLALENVTSRLIKDGSIVNADISATAGIAGTKISPDFGSQNIATTGLLNGISLSGNNLSGIIGIGYQACYVTDDSANVGIGHLVLTHNDSIYNTGVGHRALELNTTGLENSAFGAYALRRNTTGPSNTGIGFRVLSKNVSGGWNVGIGKDALLNCTTGSYNVNVGNNAGLSLTEGEYNTFIGFNAGYACTTGKFNTGIGDVSMHHLTTGYNNTGIGEYSLWSLTEGDDNVGMGMHSLDSLTTGDRNTALGGRALTNMKTGNRSIGLGNRSGYWETDSSRLFIDNRMRLNKADGRQQALIYGEMTDVDSTQFVSVNADMQSLTYNHGRDAGSTDDYVVSLNNAPKQYVQGMMIIFYAQTANTGACTINVNGLGAKSLKVRYNQALIDNTIKAGSYVIAIYDGTNFQVQSVSAGPVIAEATKNSQDAPTVTGLHVYDTTSMIVGGGGGITFFGNYTGTTSTAAAAIHAYKSSAVAGEYGFDLAFNTRVNGGTNTEKARLTSVGYWGLGTSAVLLPQKRFTLSDGTDRFSLDVASDKLTFFNDVASPAIIATVDSLGNTDIEGSLIIGGSNFTVTKVDTVFSATFKPRWVHWTSGGKDWYSQVYAAADTTGKW